jgi:hypothetical protein
MFMANQGLFFKELSTSEYVKSIVNLDDTEENITSKLLDSEELICKLKTFVDDDQFIKDKIETFVKQAFKKKQKSIDKTNIQVVENNYSDNIYLEKYNKEETINISVVENNYSDNIYLGKYNKENDSKNSNVKWITEDIRLEHVDHLIKMTTCNFEVFY